ncbi:hypothetical protein KAR48_16510 [bacterium]|nr:hypothetical protein [bacterium]
MTEKRVLICLVFFIILVWFNPVLAQDIAILRNNYMQIKADIERCKDRNDFKYFQSPSEDAKTTVLKLCSEYLFKTLCDSIFPAWYGTAWNFNGISRTPGTGGMACGSFVIITLRDAGFNIPMKMLRQPSENIIKNLTSPSNIKRFSGAASGDNLRAWVQNEGEGLYIVGLNIHVGFIINRNGHITFCHSSYYNPPLSVVNQSATEQSPLTEPGYKVIGKILTKEMLEKWLTGGEFALEYDYFRQ